MITYRSAPNFVDLIGQVFNDRKVIERLETPVYKGKRGSSRWKVQCLLCGMISESQTCGIKKHGCICKNPEASIRSGKTRTSPISPNVRHRWKHRRDTFGITQKQFEEMISAQDNRCKICERTFTKTPTIDHDHSCCSGRITCGKCIRGLLCNNCNAGLGNLGDDVGVILKAAAYLERYTRK